MTDSDDDPLPAGRATDAIREIAQSDEFGIYLTKHAKERMQERALILDDLLHVLKYGFVYKDGESSTRKGYFKYEMECRTPNSRKRVLRVVVIPSVEKKEAKIVSVMWADRPPQSG